MKTTLATLEADGYRRLFRREAPGALARATVRFAVLALACLFLSALLPGGLGRLLQLGGLLLLALSALCVAGLVFRFLFRRVLWTVRSRLVVTCLLLGLAPIILSSAMATIATYLFCGQFATSIAAQRIEDELTHELAHSTSSLSLTAPLRPGAPLPQVTTLRSPRLPDDPDKAALKLTAAWYEGKPLPLAAGGQAARVFESEAPPTWLQSGFKGVVSEGGRLFLCGAAGEDLAGRYLLILTCAPFRNEEMNGLAEGLGSVGITPNLASDEGSQDASDDSIHLNKEDPGKGAGAIGIPRQYTTVEGGMVAPAASLFDFRVYFSAPLHTVEWKTGKDAGTWLVVVSRPAVLYKRLFSSSVRAGRYVRSALMVTSLLFALIELMACLMAIALSRTITRSIADLYDATRQIDRGNLEHRIPVRRKDQLAALAASFNTMTTSLKDLLRQQREKDRLESELKVAQEVQNNLFPHSSIALPEFELFGICQPARTIGGDYYDFIPFGTSQLYLALGDISGKGISAALLMASLHSAVRAYRSAASPEMLETDVQQRNDLNVSPGKLLALLNGHLYRSTQAAKYATLFLACYDSASRRLTYSNGGHLPPIILCMDGSIKRLVCGGSVVGLLEDQRYEEETVEMHAGDVLIAYSDGLTEPEKDQVDFGEERLIDVVRRNRILPLPDIADRTVQEVRTWIGDQEQPDDMTLVLARLK